MKRLLIAILAIVMLAGCATPTAVVDPSAATLSEGLKLHDIFEDAAETARAGFAFHGELSDSEESIIGELEVDAIDFEHFSVLFDEAIFRFGEDSNERIFVEGIEGSDDGEASNEFRDDTELEEVFGF